MHWKIIIQRVARLQDKTQLKPLKLPQYAGDGNI